MAQYKPYKERFGNESKLSFYLKKFKYFYSDSISVVTDLTGVNLKTYGKQIEQERKLNEGNEIDFAFLKKL